MRLKENCIKTWERLTQKQKRDWQRRDQKAETVGTNSYYSSRGLVYGNNLREKNRGMVCWMVSISFSLTRVKTHLRRWPLHVAVHFLACNPILLPQAVTWGISGACSSHGSFFQFPFYLAFLENCTISKGFVLVCCCVPCNNYSFPLIPGFVFLSITAAWGICSTA